MRTCRRLWLSIAMIALGIITLLVWPRPSRFTEQNVKLIKEGMSRAEVESILGPPGDYTTGDISSDENNSGTTFDPLANPYQEFRLNMRGQLTEACWCNDSIALCVAFDEQSRVFMFPNWKVNRVRQSPLESLVWRAKRQWRRWFP
jgi:hypothetical protein